MTKPVPDPRDESGEILPCPFCGGAAAFDQMEMQINCRTPGCTGQSWLFDTLDDAIAAWNRRPAPPKEGSCDV